MHTIRSKLPENDADLLAFDHLHAAANEALVGEDPERAEHLARQLLAHFPCVVADRHLMMVLARRGRIEEAALVGTRAFSAGRVDGDTAAMVSMCLCALDRTQEAQAWLTFAQEHGATTDLYLLAESYGLAIEGYPTAAAELAEVSARFSEDLPGDAKHPGTVFAKALRKRLNMTSTEESA